MRPTILALAASVLATDVTVVWRHEKTTGSTSLSIHSIENDKILAERCGNALGSLDFSRVDQHGAGNFSVGGETFDVSSKLQDGVSCNRKYNGVIAVAECSGIKLDVPEGESQSADCFTDEDAKASFVALKVRNANAVAPTRVQHRGTPISTFKLRGRQQCHDEKSTVVNGDGDPHQNYFHKQLSEVINCGAAPSCSAGYEVSKSYTIGWTSGISADSWISAGFEVQESWTTGNEYTCYGASGDDVCIWYNTAHTAYTVHNHVYNTCVPNERDSDPFVIKSPNKSNRGGGMYCVIGTCRAQGDEYWDNTGRAGGP